MLRKRIVEIFDQKQSFPDQTPLVVCGWVRSKRTSKSVGFLVVNDGSCQESLQIVVDSGSPAFDILKQATTGAAVRVHGVRKDSQGKQSFELQASEIEILGSCGSDYPLQKKGHTLDFLREIGHLRPRSNTFGAVFRVRHALAQAVHRFFSDRGFYWAHTPIITSSDCEGAGEMFQVTTLDLQKPPKDDRGKTDFTNDFFGKPSFLTVSGQLEGEFMAMALGQIYTFGPTFRAENSNTTRHLSEFWMIEPEVAFADLQDMMVLAEDFFRALCADLVRQCPDELDFFHRFYKSMPIEELQKLADTPFVRISYTNAIKELKDAKVDFEFPVNWGIDLQSEHERYLTDEVFKCPVIVVDYPRDIKAFYMRVNNDERTVAAMDVLIPRVGELIGGSQREERLDVLQMRMKECSVNADHLQWYLDLRRFGSAPHAGFGLGFERLVQYLTGMSNIRDVVPCPRAPKTIGF